MSKGCVTFEPRRQQVTFSHYDAVIPKLAGFQLCRLHRDEESHESLICFTSVCLGERLLGTFDATFRGRPAETEGSGGGRGEGRWGLGGGARVAEQKWNQHPTYRGKDTQTHKVGCQ